MKKSLNIHDIKSRALKILSKCWVESAFISLLNISIPSIIYMIILLTATAVGVHDPKTILPVFTSFPPLLIALAAVLITAAYFISAPLYFGTRWFFLQAASGNYMPVSSVFACYSSANSVMRAIRIRFYTCIRKLVYLLPCIAAIGVVADLARRLSVYYNSSAVTAAFRVGTMIFIICSLVIYFILTMKYIPLGYMLAENPDSDLHDILACTQKMLDKYSSSMLLMYGSFAPWWLTYLLIFPYFFVQPYVIMITAVFIRMTVEPEPAEEDSSNNEEKPVGELQNV